MYLRCGGWQQQQQLLGNECRIFSCAISRTHILSSEQRLGRVLYLEAGEAVQNKWIVLKIVVISIIDIIIKCDDAWMRRTIEIVGRYRMLLRKWDAMRPTTSVRMGCVIRDRVRRFEIEPPFKSSENLMYSNRFEPSGGTGTGLLGLEYGWHWYSVHYIAQWTSLGRFSPKYDKWFCYCRILLYSFFVYRYWENFDS